jgi:uncharacterized membrane protein
MPTIPSRGAKCIRVSFNKIIRMTVRDILSVMAIAIILQVSLALLLYGPLRPAPGLELYSIIVAVMVMAAVSSSLAAVLYVIFSRYARERALKVAMMTLSKDERAVLELILRSKEIRQDKLRREVSFSKSKLSAIVNNLEKKGAITKTRYFKTNILRPTKEFGGG